MKKGTFEGKSTTGNLEEAIINAIAKAKENLKTDFVEWKLETTGGENGGIANANILNVSIKAKTIKEKVVKEKVVKEKKK